MTDHNNRPLLLVIFGITGDLAKRKLLPALYHLFEQGELPSQTRIIGVSRQPVEAELLLDATFGQNKPKNLAGFRKFLQIHQLDMSDRNAYVNFATELRDISSNLGSDVNRIYYLSIPAQAFVDVVEHLGQTGHSERFSNESSLPKILVEKPFGYNSRSAHQLITATEKYYHEEQVYRIDHYLAKETAQNILVFRFNNPLFQSVWNSKYIDKIIVSAYESIGVEGRANFYEQTGALRDLIQSHLLQLLALVTMEEPKTLDSAGIHRSKVRLLESIEAIAEKDVPSMAFRGQYEGYRQEVNNPNSNIETFARLRLIIDNAQWRKTEVIVESGKSLHERNSTIQVHFSGDSEKDCSNLLEFRLQPKEGITIALQAKRPGLDKTTETVEMDFDYARSFGGSSSEAYQRVMIDAIRGDQSLFASAAEVMAAWKIVENVLLYWEKSGDGLKIYPQNSSPIKL